MAQLWYKSRLDDEMAEKAGHQPSYEEAKKMKSLTLHRNGCLWANLNTAFLLITLDLRLSPSCACLHIGQRIFSTSSYYMTEIRTMTIVIVIKHLYSAT